MTEKWRNRSKTENNPKSLPNTTSNKLIDINNEKLAALNNTTEKMPLNDAKEIDNIDDVEDQLEDIAILKAPDGGYGWVIVFASFLANMIVDGVIFSIGESIVPLWEAEFQTTTSMVTIAPSLLAGFYLLSGPLASALANMFGCNKVAIAGSIIASSGFLLSVMVPALPVLYVTFGIIGGIGYGLIYLPAIVIVGQYFSERRALATGIAVCGSGVGTSLLSYFNPIVLKMVNGNWRIFLVVISGITLFGIFIGSFFKPLKPSKTQIQEATKIASEFIGRYEDDTCSVGVINVEETTSPHVAQGVAIERFTNSNGNGTEHHPFAVAAAASAHSRQRLATLIGDQRPFLSTIELHANRHLENTNTPQSQQDITKLATKASILDLNRPLSRMDIFYAGSTNKLHEHKTDNNDESVVKHRRTCSNATENNKSVLYLSTAGLPTYDDENPACAATPLWSRGIMASLNSLLDLSLLKSPSFLVLAISGFLTLSCFFVPFMFIGSLAKQNGIDQSLTKYLVVILGLVNLPARILCGMVSDHPKVDPLMVSNIAVIIGGLATALAPFFTKFWMFALYCVPFAFGVACFAALRSVICVELLGLEKLTNAYGMLMLFMGVAALTGPPFAALIKNLTNSFHISFHVMGCVMIMSGVISLPLRQINRYEMKKSTTKTATNLELRPLKE